MSAAPSTVDLLAAAVDGALWCDPSGVIRCGEVDVTDQARWAEQTALLLLGVDEHGNEVWIPSRFGEMVLRRAAAVAGENSRAHRPPVPASWSRLLAGAVRLAVRVMLRGAARR